MGHLKDAIKVKKPNNFKHVDADKLHLFLAKAIQNIDSRLIISMRRNCDHTLVFLHGDESKTFDNILIKDEVDNEIILSSRVMRNTNQAHMRQVVQQFYLCLLQLVRNIVGR